MSVKTINDKPHKEEKSEKSRISYSLKEKKDFSNFNTLSECARPSHIHSLLHFFDEVLKVARFHQSQDISLIEFIFLFSLFQPNVPPLVIASSLFS